MKDLSISVHEDVSSGSDGPETGGRPNAPTRTPNRGNQPHKASPTVPAVVSVLCIYILGTFVWWFLRRARLSRRRQLARLKAAAGPELVETRIERPRVFSTRYEGHLSNLSPLAIVKRPSEVFQTSSPMPLPRGTAQVPSSRRAIGLQPLTRTPFTRFPNGRATSIIQVAVLIAMPYPRPHGSGGKLNTNLTTVAALHIGVTSSALSCR